MLLSGLCAGPAHVGSRFARSPCVLTLAVIASYKGSIINHLGGVSTVLKMVSQETCKVRFHAVAGFARIRITGNSLNSCESSYIRRRLCNPPAHLGRFGQTLKYRLPRLLEHGASKKGQKFAAACRVSTLLAALLSAKSAKITKPLQIDCSIQLLELVL